MRRRTGGVLLAVAGFVALGGPWRGADVPTQGVSAAADAALAAAARLLNASAAPDCTTPNNAGINCIRPAEGLMPSNADQGGGVSVYMGRAASGGEGWYGISAPVSG